MPGERDHAGLSRPSRRTASGRGASVRSASTTDRSRGLAVVHGLPLDRPLWPKRSPSGETLTLGFNWPHLRTIINSVNKPTLLFTAVLSTRNLPLFRIKSVLYNKPLMPRQQETPSNGESIFG